MFTKSFTINNRKWNDLTSLVTMVEGTLYCIQPNKSTLLFYQGDSKPSKDDFGISVDPSGIIKFKFLSGVHYNFRVLEPGCVVTITEVAA